MPLSDRDCVGGDMARMKEARHIPLLTLCGLLLASCQTYTNTNTPVFQPEWTKKPTPWTNTRFKNDPNEFQFMIVSDRTGGLRPGIFARALDKVNLFQPEFVMCVGDLAEGYTESPERLSKDWARVRAAVAKLEMPFFYVCGNHDVSNELTAQAWHRQFGRPYYYFLYRNVLFLCLDTQDGADYHGGLSETQIAWAKDVLARHRDVRWTCVFMHQPLWENEQREARRRYPRRFPVEPTPIRFSEFTKTLHGRRCTVFMGHHHRYQKCVRDGIEYFVLGSTGGFTDRDDLGTSAGWMDHVTWVTMTSNGPLLANVMLDGIYDEEFYSETIRQHVRATLAPFGALRITQPRGRIELPERVTVPLANDWDTTMTGTLIWEPQPDGPWQVDPMTNVIEVAPGATQELSWRFTCTASRPEDPDSLHPMPTGTLQLRNEERVLWTNRWVGLRFDIWPYWSAKRAFALNLQSAPLALGAAPLETNITIWPYNPLNEQIEAQLEWQNLSKSGWQITPRAVTLRMPPSQDQPLEFQVAFKGSHTAFFPVPSLAAQFTAQDGLSFSNRVALQIQPQAYLARHVPQARCRRVLRAPTIDGRLDDSSWQRAPDMKSMVLTRLDALPTMPTEAWLGYDAANLYVAIRCAEQDMAGLVTNAVSRDHGNMRYDDHVQFVLDTQLDNESTCRISVNANGVLSDSRKFVVPDWDGAIDCAVHRAADAWSVELAVPWAELDIVAPKPGTRMGLDLTRRRSPAPREYSQWAPMAKGRDAKALIGVLTFE